jgi:hypothetical protein
VRTAAGRQLASELDVPAGGGPLEHRLVDLPRPPLPLVLQLQGRAAGEPVKLLVGCARGQAPFLEDPSTGETGPTLDLSVSPEVGSLRLRVLDYDPTRELEVEVRGDLSGRAFVAPGSVTRELCVLLHPPSRLRIVSEEPWPTKDFALFWRRPVGREKLFDWPMPPGIWEWRVDQLGEQRLDVPWSGMITLVEGETETVTLRRAQ